MGQVCQVTHLTLGSADGQMSHAAHLALDSCPRPPAHPERRWVRRWIRAARLMRGSAVIAISPEGKLMVGDRSDGIWVLPIGGGAGTRILMVGPGSGNTIWSPDGRYIARSLNEGIGRMAANGGGNLDVLYRVNTWPAGGLVAPKSWSPDGRFILFDKVIPGTPTDLVAIDVQHESKPIPIATTPANESQGQFSPDGHWVA
jgi:Tol biopolymer transport system component